MTFTPTPKADLWTAEQEYDAWVALGQQLFSRQYHSQAAQDSFASNIADLYARLPGAGGFWLWAGTGQNVDPGVGRMSVIITSGNSRIITIAKTDADGVNLAGVLGLAQGSTLVLTDDPTSPPTTAFRQYLVTGPAVDHPTWAQAPALRIATYGTQDIPALGTRVRLLFR